MLSLFLSLFSPWFHAKMPSLVLAFAGYYTINENSMRKILKGLLSVFLAFGLLSFLYCFALTVRECAAAQDIMV